MRARPTGRYDEVAQASAAVVIECYSTSFGWATRLLAEPVRTHVRCIYALVRVADELVDDVDLAWDREQRAALLDAMEEDTRRALEIGGSPNLVVHAFARTAADRVVFMAEGEILEENTPEEFFTNPRSDRAKDFLGKILKH